jgi:hypothetical protein
MRRWALLCWDVPLKPLFSKSTSNAVHSASWIQFRSYLKEKVAATVYKTENTVVGIRCADHATPSIRKVGTKFADKRRSLGRYSSLADKGPGRRKEEDRNSDVSHTGKEKGGGGGGGRGVACDTDKRGPLPLSAGLQHPGADVHCLLLWPRSCYFPKHLSVSSPNFPCPYFSPSLSISSQSTSCCISRKHKASRRTVFSILT